MTEPQGPTAPAAGGQPPGGQPGGPPPPAVYPAAPGYPPGFGPPPSMQPKSSSSVGASPWWAALSLLAIVLALSIPENKRLGWSELQVWAGFAVVCSALLFAPAARETFNWTPERAWKVAAGGCAGLALFWILFVLPDIGRNTSFAATVALVAAALAVWLAPGQPDRIAAPPQTW